METIARTIDFSINGLTTENRLRSIRTPTPYKIKVNNCKLIDLAIRRVNSSNFNATILKFSKKFYNPFSHDFMFGNLFPESHGFVAMPVTSSIKDTCSNLSLSNSSERRNCSTLWPVQQRSRDSQETCYQIWKHAKNGWSNFSENLRILSIWVNSILITKSINIQLFSLILYRVGGPLWFCHL